jgi:two-component system sensor histidine kinase QseC
MDDLAPILITPRYAELKPLAAALDNFLARLRAKVGREHAFVQDAAHELRTPLAVISVQAHVLTKEPDAHGRHLAQQQLELAIARASHLIGQLLQLARVDSAGARQELVHAARTAMNNDLELSLEAPGALPFTLDVHAFQSILHNLLDNALHYVPAGGRIEVTLDHDNGMLTLVVADDGPGIAAEERALVFERFHRRQGHDKPGSGLGLAIVKQAAQRLRATIQLTTGLDGGGCAFVLAIATRPCQQLHVTRSV